MLRVLTIITAVLLFVSSNGLSAEELVLRSGKVLQMRDWSDTEAGNLLRQLEIHQAEESNWDDIERWLSLIKEVVDLGSDAVPELMKHLDETPNDETKMLRTQVFILRAIGDRRAMPALIRNIVKCYQPSTSDYGLSCKDGELLKFARKHEANQFQQRDKGFGYGRPVTETFGTLGIWTQQSTLEPGIHFVQADENDTDRQKQLKRSLYESYARQWEQWWEQHWKEYVKADAYTPVGLKITEEAPIIEKLDRDAARKETGGSSGLRVESPFENDAVHVFYDLDTGRFGPLPVKYRKLDDDQLRTAKDELVDWAWSEGYDLMGWQEEIEGKTSYLVIPIAMDAWQVLPGTNTQTSLIHIEQIGRKVDGNIDEVKVSQQGQRFVFVTNENTVGVFSLDKVDPNKGGFVKFRFDPEAVERAYFNPGWVISTKALVVPR